MSSSDITQAVEILRRGGLVAIPTETVYGLAGDARNEAAVRRIFEVKGRPADHPLIVHLAAASQSPDWAIAIPDQVWLLAEAFWPGPLTLILKKHPSVLDVVTGGQDTIGLRVPAHPIAHTLLAAFGSGLAAPSANQFTHISPTTASAVKEELGDKVQLILDGGDCTIGLESTILDMSGDAPRILRPGMISSDAIEAVLGQPVVTREVPAHVRAPGMHHVHYAPLTLTRLMSLDEILSYIANAKENELPLAILTYHDLILERREGVRTVRLSSDAKEYAHDLYRVLRELDAAHLKQILIEKIPDAPSWDAIRDRLGKAAR